MFNENNKIKKIGEKTGYIAMYIIFTTILYFILKIFNKLPETWTYFHIMILTIFIVLVGTLIKLLLR